jgi:L-threonylcarbamoyladenylate synthase
VRWRRPPIPCGPAASSPTRPNPATGCLILISDRFERLERYLEPLEAGVRERIAASWPGPVTWLLPARPTTSAWLRGQHATLAVRVTAHAGAAALCRHTRSALVSTSANRHGRAPARSAGAVQREFGDNIDYVLEGRLGQLARPTEIRDALSGAIIRPG